MPLIASWPRHIAVLASATLAMAGCADTPPAATPEPSSATVEVAPTPVDADPDAEVTAETAATVPEPADDPASGAGVAPCCEALRLTAASAPLQQKGAYLAASGACNALRGNPAGRSGLASVRAMLAGASVPAACR